jgi:outer membrane receptor for ferrienterochelin and colicins
MSIPTWLSASVGARVDWHSEYGAFVSPEETEAAGLTRLAVQAPLRAERGTSVSRDLTRTVGPVSLTATACGSRITDSVAVDRDTRYVLFNRDGATTNAGAELFATARRGPWVGTGTYTYGRSREAGDSGHQDVALTPRMVRDSSGCGKGKTGDGSSLNSTSPSGSGSR